MPTDAPDASECRICGRRFPRSELMPADLIRESIAATIRKARPDWDGRGFVCLIDLSRFRAEHVEDVLEAERGELSALEAEVVRSLQEHELIARDINAAFDRRLTFGERLSDRIAEFGGSWTFILSFLAVLVVWVAINSLRVLFRPWDPYPYILLNLILSCLAALQAPVIMMSQNRQEAKDRLRGEHDYRIDLKAELEVRNLNAKMDLLLTHQWRRLLEIQKIQMEMMDELIRRAGRDGDDPE